MKKKDTNLDENEQVIERGKIGKKSNSLFNTNDRIKKLRKTLVLMLILLLVIYFVLRIVYQTGRFTITLDTSSDMKGALVMYANKNEKLTRRTLQADVLDFITNISEDWLPANINDEADGGHNRRQLYSLYVLR